MEIGKTKSGTDYILRLKSAFGSGYFMAVLLVAAAFALASVFGLKAEQRPLSLLCFFTAVALSAASGGLKPGLLATVLSALAYDFFFLYPLHSIFIERSDLPLFALFLLVALLMNALSGKLKAETQELATLRDELNQIMAALSVSLNAAVVAQTLKAQLTKRLHIPGGLIFLATDGNGLLDLSEFWGIPASVVARRNAYWTLADFHPRFALGEEFAPVAGAFAGLPAFAEEAEIAQMNWKSYLFLPLVTNGTLHGLLCLFDTSSQGFGRGRQEFFETLGSQVSVILQNARLYERVESGRENLERLSRQLVKVQEAERHAIARELHDEIGQALTGLKLGLEMRLRLPEAARENHMRGQIEAIHELMTRVSDLSLNLRPAMLDDLGLLPTLLWHFERYTATTGVQVTFEHNGLERRFSFEVETTAYRVIQEALTNVARHACSQDVTVRLWAAPQALLLQITDSGQGFDVEVVRRNWHTGGLTGMEERLKLLGGQLHVEAAPGQGVCLTAELPTVALDEENAP